MGSQELTRVKTEHSWPAEPFLSQPGLAFRYSCVQQLGVSCVPYVLEEMYPVKQRLQTPTKGSSALAGHGTRRTRVRPRGSEQ